MHQHAHRLPKSTDAWYNPGITSAFHKFHRIQRALYTVIAMARRPRPNLFPCVAILLVTHQPSQVLVSNSWCPNMR